MAQENFLGYEFHLSPLDPWREIFCALLSEFPFESFIDTDNGFTAYIKESQDCESDVKAIIESLTEVDIRFEKKHIETVNWNAEWEKSFSPINVENKCLIRAEFHPPQPEIPLEIIIQPKMSFGTGHHETTYLMSWYLLDLDVKQKTVLDMGTGTGILAILAMKQGAASVHGIDIDEWSYENACENAQRNNVEATFEQGDASNIQGKYDWVLANINKNILLADMHTYVEAMNPKGKLILSGIYDFDRDDIVEKAESLGLKWLSEKQKNQWMAIEFSN